MAGSGSVAAARPRNHLEKGTMHEGEALEGSCGKTPLQRERVGMPGCGELWIGAASAPRMAERKPHGPEVPCASVDAGRLRIPAYLEVAGKAAAAPSSLPGFCAPAGLGIGRPA